MSAEPKAPEIQSAHAILVLNSDYILQLRDDKPTIAAAGQWSLFGGKIKSGETPFQSINREVYEELAIRPVEYSYLWFTDHFASFEKAVIRTWFFTSDVTTVWTDYRLKEGKAVKVFPFERLAGLDMPPVMYQTLERFHRKYREGDED